MLLWWRNIVAFRRNNSWKHNKNNSPSLPCVRAIIIITNIKLHALSYCRLITLSIISTRVVFCCRVSFLISFHKSAIRDANNESSEVCGIINPGRRVSLNRSQAVKVHKLVTIRDKQCTGLQILNRHRFPVLIKTVRLWPKLYCKIWSIL